MTTDDDLLGLLSTALAPDPREPPTQLIGALRAAATLHAESPGDDQLARVSIFRPGRMRRFAPLIVAAAAVAGFFIGGALQNQRDGRDLVAGGVVEFEMTLKEPRGERTVAVTGIRTGIGRVVQLRTRALPILPKGDFYELWFVGPGDTPGSPNRISAGTFHPDEDGRSDVDLTAAVDPVLYPRIAITAEPKGGNPSPHGPDLLQGGVTIQKR